VREVRVFDSKGREAFSQSRGRPDAGIMAVLRTGKDVYVRKRVDGEEMATYITPLHNKPECRGCHGEGERLRGAILLSLSLHEMQENIAQENQNYFIVFAFTIVLISLVTVVAVNGLFLRPLGRLRIATNAIERGDFDYHIPVKSRDEIGSLAERFNQMAQTLRNSFQEIERKSREWQETFDCITDPMAVVDADCTIIRANRAFRDVFQEFFATRPTGAVHGKCDELFGSCLLADCPHKTALKEKRPIVHEVRGPKTGRVFQVSMFPYSSPEGDFVGSVAIIKDITVMRENEMRLIMSERLSALGQMASGIAHELMNPMATVSLCVEGLLNRLKKQQFDPALFENYLKTVEEEVNRCRGITTNMLSLVRKGCKEEKAKEVSINELIDKTLDLLSFQGRLMRVEVRREYQENMPRVRLDEGEMRQVLLSVVLNALDAMEDEGALTLRTGAQGETAFIEVSDTGPGISPHIADKVFEPFFTTKSQRGGTGLGLSISRRLIKEKGGDIQLTSEEGKGATFKITLPV
jgi:signal transduction histidine kinase